MPSPPKGISVQPSLTSWNAFGLRNWRWSNKDRREHNEKVVTPGSFGHQDGEANRPEEE
jgi:hypothetical protein